MRAHALLGLLLALPLLAPAAHAHGAAFEAAERGEDGALVEARIEGAPLPAALAPLVLRVTLDEGAPAEEVVARLVPPADAPAEAFALARDAETRHPNDWVARVVFTHAGTWRILVETPAGAGGAREFAVEVHAASPWFASLAEGESGVVASGAPPRDVRLAVRDARGQAATSLESARILLEHEESGARLDATARVHAPGVLAFTPPSVDGAYRVHVLAPQIGLDEGARPPLTLLVVPPEEASVYGAPEARETPPPGGAWTLAALAALARAVRGRVARSSGSDAAR